MIEAGERDAEAIIFSSQLSIEDLLEMKIQTLKPSMMNLNNQ